MIAALAAMNLKQWGVLLILTSVSGEVRAYEVDSMVKCMANVLYIIRRNYEDVEMIECREGLY